MTLPEVMYHNIDVSGGVRTPPLIQIIYIYVITHGHRTRHDPLHRATGRQGTHDTHTSTWSKRRGNRQREGWWWRKSSAVGGRGPGGKLIEISCHLG